MHNNKILFIPIKEHSARVSRKNFRDFNGVPLYMYTLNKYVDKDVSVYVDTDSEEVMGALDMMHLDGKMLNVTPMSRKKSLRGDNVSVNLLIENFIDTHIDKERWRDVWIGQIHVTNPFLSAETVLDALCKAESDGTVYEDTADAREGFDSVASVTTHNCRFWRNDGYGFCPVNHNPMKLEKTQDLPTFFEENSCFYIFNPHNFKAFGSYRVGKSPLFYPVNFPENIDIDTENDWCICNSLAKSGVLS